MHVRDVVKANLLAASKPGTIGKALNIASGREVSINELARLVLRLAGLGGLRPEHGPPRPGDIRRSWADIAKARRLLGYEPEVGLEEGIRELLTHSPPSMSSKPSGRI